MQDKLESSGLMRQASSPSRIAQQERTIGIGAKSEAGQEPRTKWDAASITR
ncbi:hypothetical protein RISK_000294 [Rhodopirellula islandica]|uniref:Uncharacterized protein n=1 Tax=Rhodopirellula islandica TaxID=595434 RepID=A0A0J1BMJ6_RHOIS|nr:hypothetical protein RISK_000294 [Rhodopirellula islandica]